MRLILNADDFGMDADTLSATIECFEQGLLTSASIMTGMAETDEALDFARRRPDLSFGVHLQFVGNGTETPVSDPHDIPGLVDARGRLLPTNVVRLRGMLRRLDVDEIVRETVAQVELVKASGVEISHVDSHRHLHKLAPFREALERALPTLGVSKVRNVQDVYLRRPIVSPTSWAGPVWRRALMRSFTTTDHFYMPTSAHDEDWHALAARLPDGDTLEIGLHPGRLEPWRRSELESLAPFVEAVLAAGHSLIGWAAV